MTQPAPGASSAATGLGRQLIERLALAAAVISIFLIADRGAHSFGDTHGVIVHAARMLEAIEDHEPGAIRQIFDYPLDRDAGRVWPLTRPYFLLLYVVFGTSFVAYQAWTCALLVATVQLIYSLAARLTTHRFAPMLAGTLFVLYFPTVQAIHMFVWLELVITPLICAALLCLLAIERRARDDAPPLGTWAAALGAAMCTVATLALKETSIVLATGVCLVAAVQAWRGPRALRVPALFVAAVVAVAGAALAYAVLTGPMQQGWYTESYDPADPGQWLANVEWWRGVMLTVYGPLAVVWLAAVAVRAGLALREKNLDLDLVWRVMPPLLLIGMAVLTSPKSNQSHFYINPALAVACVGMAREATGLWSLLARTATSPAESARPVQVLAGLCLLSWALPLPSGIGEPVWLALKVLAVLMCAYALANAVAHERAQLSASGAVSLSAARLGRALFVLIALHLALFPAPNVYLLARFEQQKFKAMSDMCAYLAEHVPRNGRVAAVGFGNPWQVEQIGHHLAMCEHREDIVAMFVPRGGEPDPSADVVVLAGPRYLGGSEETPPDSLSFPAQAWVYKPDRFQPARWTAALARRWRGDRHPWPRDLFYPYFVDCGLCEFSLTRIAYAPSPAP